MTLLDKTLRDIKEIESISKSLPFDPKDIRHCFFLKIVESLNTFYFGHVLIQLSCLANAGRLKMTGTPSENEKFHLTSVLCLDRKPWHGSYKSALNRHLIIDSWTAFEIAITTILDKRLEKDQMDHMQLYQYYEVEKLLKKSSSAIDAEVLQLLEKKLKQTHIPINRKIDRLFSIIKGDYSRNVKFDKKFLTFFGHLRNSMHNNFIYSGNEYEYVFNQVKVSFKKNKFLWFSAQEEEIPFFQLDIVKELALIFQAMVNAIEPGEPILDPMLNGAYLNQ